MGRNEKMNKTLTIMVVMSLFAVALVAAAVDTSITGMITYADGTTPVVGANVEVNCNGNIKNDLSDSDGLYSVTYTLAECDALDTVSVTATLGEMSGSNTGTVCAEGECPFNVAVVDVSIPEFTTVGLIAVALAGIGVLAFRRR
jgi:hypothetical protein